MHRATKWMLALAVLAMTTVAALAQQEKAPDGKDLFLNAKCNTCHSVKALGIEKKKPAQGEEKKPAEAGESSAKKAPDLSSVGLDKKADWISKFLLKKETLDGEKHKKLYKGTEAELGTLSAWLESQKAPKKKGAK